MADRCHSEWTVRWHKKCTAHKHAFVDELEKGNVVAVDDATTVPQAEAESKDGLIWPRSMSK
jgi:hypothetical protein